MAISAPSTRPFSNRCTKATESLEYTGLQVTRRRRSLPPTPRTPRPVPRAPRRPHHSQPQSDMFCSSRSLCHSPPECSLDTLLPRRHDLASENLWHRRELFIDSRKKQRGGAAAAGIWDNPEGAIMQIQVAAPLRPPSSCFSLVRLNEVLLDR